MKADAEAMVLGYTPSTPITADFRIQEVKLTLRTACYGSSNFSALLPFSATSPQIFPG
jgi:hypothetical protein